MKKALIFLILGILLITFLITNNTLTGFSIGGSGERVINSFLFFLSLIFLSISVVLFIIQEKSLEAIVVPTGTLEDCEKRVSETMKKYGQKTQKPLILISGEIHREESGRPKKETQPYFIYKILREKYGLRPSDMIVEGSSYDSLENFLYSIEKARARGIKKLYISTNPTHYWRFMMFEKEAKKEGLIDPSFEIVPIYVSENPRSFVYGLMALVKDYLKIKSAGSLDEAREKRMKVGKGVKSFLS